MTITKSLIPLALIITSLPALSSETYDVDALVANAKPITIDLAKVKNISLDEAEPGIYNINVINILPSKRNDYEITVNKEVLKPSPFTKPKATAATGENEGADKGREDGFSSSESFNECNAVNLDVDKHINNIYSLEDEAALSIHLTKLKKITNLELCPLALGKTHAVNAATQYSKIVNFQTSQKLSVSVKKQDKELVAITLTDAPREWLVHAGLTFLDNKDKSFFSQKIESMENPDAGNMNEGGDGTTDSYMIMQGAARNSISYAATALFTYPFSNAPSGFGLSVGVAAAEDNIAALVGLSYVVNTNFVLSVGGIITEFDVLKNQYSVGQDIGSNSIDSTALVDQTYKFTPMITLAYKFSE